MILTPPGYAEEGQPGEPQLRPEYVGGRAPSTLLDSDYSLLGARGTAVSMLRPAGKARIGGRLLDVVSEGPFIAQGSDIEVIGVEGVHVVVRETA
jgi:membrane-bound serine protease (ClpP class)